MCKATGLQLEPRHISHNRLGCERTADLIIRCHRCHFTIGHKGPDKHANAAKLARIVQDYRPCALIIYQREEPAMRGTILALLKFIADAAVHIRPGPRAAIGGYDQWLRVRHDRRGEAPKRRAVEARHFPYRD